MFPPHYYSLYQSSGPTIFNHGTTHFIPSPKCNSHKQPNTNPKPTGDPEPSTDSKADPNLDDP